MRWWSATRESGAAAMGSWWSWSAGEGHVRGQPREQPRPDAPHLPEPLERAEGALPRAVVDDPARERRPDAGEGLERRRVGDVDVDRALRRTSRNRRASARQVASWVAWIVTLLATRPPPG